MFKASQQLPPLSLLIDDLPTRCTRTIARHLGISERTLKRYQEQDQAPRLVMLALFWETRWGQSVLDCEVWNRDQVQRGLIEALQTERGQLLDQVAHLAAMLAGGGHGAANDPFMNGPGPGVRIVERTAQARRRYTAPDQPPQLQPLEPDPVPRVLSLIQARSLGA